MPIVGQNQFAQFAQIMQQSEQFALAARKLQLAEEQFKAQQEAQQQAFKLHQEKWAAEKELLSAKLQQAEFTAQLQEQTGPFFQQLVKGAGGLSKSLSTGDPKQVNKAVDQITQVMSSPQFRQALPQGPAFLGSLLDALQVPETMRARLGAGKVDRLRQTERTADVEAAVEGIVAAHGALNTQHGVFATPEDIEKTHDRAIEHFRTTNAPLNQAVQLLTSSGRARMASEAKAISDYLAQKDTNSAVDTMLRMRGSLQQEKEETTDDQTLRVIDETLNNLTNAYNQIQLEEAKFSVYHQLMSHYRGAVRSKLTENVSAFEEAGEGDPIEAARRSTAGWARDLKKPITRALNDPRVVQTFNDYLTTSLSHDEAQRNEILAKLGGAIGSMQPALNEKEVRYLFHLMRGVHPFYKGARAIE